MRAGRQLQDDQISVVPWKRYLKLTAESLLTFYLSTFCMAMYFTHGGLEWILMSVFLGVLYVFVILICAKRVFEKLSIAALMLVIPIAPFLALATVVSLIPVLEYFR